MAEEISEHSEALYIANQWLDFKMNALTQMVPGDPDCDACIVARQFIRTEEHCQILMASNAALTSEILRLRTGLLRIASEVLAEKDRLIASLYRQKAELMEALTAIRNGTINGKVSGEDVVWFDEITTLHDFCDEQIASAATEKGEPT
jgi:hypothetical protein